MAKTLALHSLGIAAAGLVAACSGAVAPAETSRPEPPPAPGPTAVSVAPTSLAPAPASKRSAAPVGTLLERLMKSHFEQVATIRAAVIADKIDDAIEPARLIVEMQGVDTLPQAWRSSVRELQAASDRVRQSADLPGAASATADIGMTCGGCHIATSGPTVKVPPPPAVDSTVAGRMRRHLWATERLWEGLYGPSNKAWQAGAEVLASAPFPKAVLAPGGVHAKSLAGRFAKLASKAPTTRDKEGRAQLYASLLATCAPCHQLIRDKR